MFSNLFRRPHFIFVFRKNKLREPDMWFYEQKIIASFHTALLLKENTFYNIFINFIFIPINVTQVADELILASCSQMV